MPVLWTSAHLMCKFQAWSDKFLVLVINNIQILIWLFCIWCQQQAWTGATEHLSVLKRCWEGSRMRTSEPRLCLFHSYTCTMSNLLKLWDCKTFLGVNDWIQNNSDFSLLHVYTLYTFPKIFMSSVYLIFNICCLTSDCWEIIFVMFLTVSITFLIL